MKIFSSVKAFLSINLEQLMDKAVSPEQEINQFVMEAEKAVKEYSTQLNLVRSEESRYRDQLDKLDSHLKNLEAELELLIENGNKDLARHNLTKQDSLREQQVELNRLVAEKEASVNRMKEEYKDLRSRLTEARTKQAQYMARLRKVDADSRLLDAQEKLALDPISGEFGNCTRMEEKLAKKEASNEMRKEFGNETEELAYRKGIQTLKTQQKEKSMDDRLEELFAKKAQ
ncbi:PspA/IM30 family protein [Anaeromusa acidaminophila]|uniref:PspA/IM30 family protein n=1 Tax=Anaeromusa acidaminophila TaxID=81464 RepID=UPI000366FF3B|nr:PspA/IM30 family protein [Anaeromusa acidaminophila]